MKKGETDNSFGIASVVLGIISVISLSVPGVVFGIIGLIFGLKQKKINKNKWSKAGIIINIVGIVLGIVATVIIIVYASSYAGQLQGLGNA